MAGRAGSAFTHQLEIRLEEGVWGVMNEGFDLTDFEPNDGRQSFA